MTTYQILAVISSYLGLLVTVAVILNNISKSISKRFENGAVKMAVIQKEIDTIKEDLKNKADENLVQEQLKNINDKLDDIKEALKK